VIIKFIGLLSPGELVQLHDWLRLLVSLVCWLWGWHMQVCDTKF